MKTSFAILALLGLVSFQDVNAISIQRRHRNHVPGVTFLNERDEEPDKEAQKIAEQIAKDKASEEKAELVAAQKEQLEKLKDEIEAEKHPPKLNEEDEKAATDIVIKKLEEDALAGNAEEKIKKAEKIIKKAKEEKKEVDADVVAEKADQEQFLANREVKKKEEQAVESLEEVKKAEKKLKVAKLEAEVEAFKQEEEKALGLVVEKIKEQKKVTPLPMEADPRIAKFEEGLKEMAKKEDIAEAKAEAKARKLDENPNQAIKAQKDALAKYDADNDKYAEERAAFEAKKAKALAKEKAEETKRIRILAKQNSNDEDYVGGLPQHHFKSGYVFDQPCAAGGCYGSKPLDGPGVPGWAPWDPHAKDE